ncbi:MAG TPA: HlyD family type I secretion periplasmic adaptor subunit [Aliidongia sp.]|nr:HlyD family type I secretion periplasmic adaptor subunit [Aliidongia sp.]
MSLFPVKPATGTALQLVAPWQARLAAEAPEPSLKRVGTIATLGLVMVFGGLLTWGCLFDLDAAAVAGGTVVVESSRKTIDHLEGGILRELLVDEGDHVKKGQPLLRLDAVQSDAALGEQTSQFRALLVHSARLRAEQRDEREMSLPPELQAIAGEPDVAKLITAERELFHQRLQTFDNTVDVQRKKIDQLNEQIASFKVQIAATKEREHYTADELVGVKSLFDKGFETKPRMLDLQSQLADVKGKLGELSGNIAQSQQMIAGAELEILGARQQRQSDAGTSLQDTSAQLAALRERLTASADISHRRTIVSPQDGIITDMHYHTLGAVIPPAQPILDIVPVNDDMIVEAQILPIDIEHVKLGEPANVRLLAYKQHKVPILQGTVTYVSADKLTDPKGQDYFLARITLPASDFANLHNVTMRPGMPCEVMVLRGERKAIDYFISPILESTRRAFRED